MLDHQDGAVGRDLLDELDHAPDVLVAHALGRLVQQHQLGVERQRGRDLERALAPVGHLHRHGVGKAAEVDRLSSSIARPLSSVETLLRFPEVERVAALALQADAHVLEHRQVREVAEIWTRLATWTWFSRA